MKYTLRPYQEVAVQECVDYFHNEHLPGVATLPTGSGKSLIIAALIDRLGHPATLVLQPSKELLEQNYDKFRHYGEASLYSASVGVKEVGEITYATIGSIKNKPEDFSHIKLILIDECHLGTGSQGMIDTFVKSFKKKPKIIGLTATPIRLKAYSDYGGSNYSQLNILTRMRPKFFSKLFHITQVGTLYEQGYLCPLRYTTFNFDRSTMQMKGTDYNMESASKSLREQGMMERCKTLLKESLARGKKKVLIFTPTVGDSMELQRLVPEVRVVSAKTNKKERSKYVADFKAGRTRVISNFGTLTTGFDVPDLDLIIMMRPTNSYALYYQMCGRGIRIYPGKEVCDLIDLSGNYPTFGDVKDLVIEDYQSQGWGMYVKDYLITGIPIGQKIHKKHLDITKRKITFGRHNGKLYTEVPTSYLQWIHKNFDTSAPWYKKEVVPVLKHLNII